MIKYVVSGLVVFFGLFLLLGSVQTIDSGEIGVKVIMGKVEKAPLREGVHFMSPFSTDVYVFSTRLITSEYTIQAYTKDVQQAKVSVQVSFNLNPDHAVNIYTVSGENWQTNIFDGLAIDAAKTVIGRWEAVDMISNRNKVVEEIESYITSRIGQRLKERGVSENAVSINMISLADVAFSSEFEVAVESKVKATQDAERAKNETVRIQEEANQKIISAKAEAESMRIRANALTQNAALVEYEAVQKWDGKLPQYMLGNSSPFIKLK